MMNLRRVSRASQWILVILLLCAALCMSGGAAASGQTAKDGESAAAKLPEFEVATIKPHPAGDRNSSMGGPPGRYEAKNVNVKQLVVEAFNVPPDQVSGGPPWLESQRFDISAKISDTRWDEIKGLDSFHRNQAINLMLQPLLKERFGLAITHQPKELMVYALTVARGGAKLRVAGAPEPADTGSRVSMMAMEQKDAPITALADFLSGHFRRTVLDRTGLTGKYDINFHVGIPDDNSPDERDLAVFRALEDQLGLRLVSRKEVVDTIVIEHLEQPSEN
jgi:uncharacterized protein (TIGR03435 family)